MLTPQQFVEKWRNTPLKERQSYQLHFMDVCQLVDHEPPGGAGHYKGQIFRFEEGVQKTDGGTGFADVYYQGHFAIEYKAPNKYKDLQEAYRQLQRYRENLKNPPLLVVTDIQNWEIHTNWPNTEPMVYRFEHDQLLEPEKRNLLRALFYEPNRLHPENNTVKVTEEAAFAFKAIADNMREWDANPETIARFLTKLVFSLFAEDVGLLPVTTSGRGLFTEIVDETRMQPDAFKHFMGQLFDAMRNGGWVMLREVPYFNGSLFDDVQVARLGANALNELDKACHLNWSSVEPAIFGTLFERTLDPAKRSQLGAHYTSPADIELILEPVLMQPLRREWAALLEQAAPLRQQYEQAATPRERIQAQNDLLTRRENLLLRLKDTKVLDPACGSGNFLYMALRLLLNLEKEIITHPLWKDLPAPEPRVHPRQMYGIETHPIAHDLASISVWIGYLQWREENGYPQKDQPILEYLGDNIRRMDAIMTPDGTEPDWPEVDVIVGNPPFLGDKKMRGELGDAYVEKLRKLYEGRVPGGADLVCYWFEKARAQIEQGKAKRAGLLATNSIRGGANREVLKRIKESGDIFMAWSDREWTLDGAAVRVSMVGFDGLREQSRTLDGLIVSTINADLTASVDIGNARKLKENTGIGFIGDSKKGAFDIPNELAHQMLNETNSSGRSNSDVVRRWFSAEDIVQAPRNMWIIDFGIDMDEEEAKLYASPYNYLLKHVKPMRDQVRNPSEKRKWWLHARPAPDYRNSVKSLTRVITTPIVAKHRIFVWIDSSILASHAAGVFAREDDYFFGVLHSRIHEVWALRMGTSLEDRPRYTPTTTFETFPFPWSPGQEAVNSPAYQAVSAAAKRLHEEREAWLNAPKLSERERKDRTLTNLYNALNVWRGKEKMKVKDSAGDFAPRLAELHDALDAAVCAAYGWDVDVLGDEEAILSRLLALNGERSQP